MMFSLNMLDYPMYFLSLVGVGWFGGVAHKILVSPRPFGFEREGLGPGLDNYNLLQTTHYKMEVA